MFATKHFAVFRFCPEQTCLGIQDDEERRRRAEEDQDDNVQDDGQEGAEGEEEESQEGAEGEEEESDDGAEGEEEESDDGAGDDQEEEQELSGARGIGCQSNYGEYMIELEDFLQIMLEYEEERFQAYCDYCEDCMQAVYWQWMKNMGGRELNEDITYEQWRQHYSSRELGDYYSVCPEYDLCVTYNNVCGHGLDDDLTEYFKCTEVQRNNGMVAYIGPHCAEDGYKITLGIYADEECNQYIGKGVNIQTFIGQQLDEDPLSFYYNNEQQICIPCRAGVRPLFQEICFHDQQYELF